LKAGFGKRWYLFAAAMRRWLECKFRFFKLRVPTVSCDDSLITRLSSRNCRVNLDKYKHVRLRPYLWFYGRIAYGALRVLAVPYTVLYKVVPLTSTVR